MMGNAYTRRIAALADEALTGLTTTVRGNGDEVVVVVEDAPSWIDDLARAANGPGLPDDHRFVMLRAVLYALSDNAGDVDEARESLEAPLYTGALLAWLIHDVGHLDYCDQAMHDFGLDSMIAILRCGYQIELLEVFSTVLDFLTDRVESAEAAE